jgi:hypothetical protein
MGALLKVIAVIFWAISAFLVYAVIHAAASAGGARVGVAIGYVVGAIVLSFLGVRMWRRPAKTAAGPIAS